MENNKNTEKPLKILYIYRHPDMGYSIGKVFKPIEEEMRKYAEVDSVYLPVPNYSLYGLWRNIKAARTAIKNKKYDLVHITGTENYLIPFIKNTKIIVTVHDVRFFSGNMSYVRVFLKYILFVLTLKFADIATFISDKSKDDTYKMINLGNKSVVINNPVGNEYKYQKKKCKSNCPSILHIGTKPNKNLIRTIDALKGFNCKLRIVGYVDNELIQRLNDNHIDYTIVMNLTDEQLVKEYEKCDIVNFPSLEEGFGMPIIEGQAIGRLVVTSNRLPMSDIAGKGAIIVDPENVESIRIGYEKALKVYDDIVRLGLENVNRFNLKKITENYYAIYRRIIN